VIEDCAEDFEEEARFSKKPFMRKKRSILEDGRQALTGRELARYKKEEQAASSSSHSIAAEEDTLLQQSLTLSSSNIMEFD